MNLAVRIGLTMALALILYIAIFFVHDSSTFTEAEVKRLKALSAWAALAGFGGLLLVALGLIWG